MTGAISCVCFIFHHKNTKTERKGARWRVFKFTPDRCNLFLRKRTISLTKTACSLHILLRSLQNENEMKINFWSRFFERVNKSLVVKQTAIQSRRSVKSGKLLTVNMLKLNRSISCFWRENIAVRSRYARACLDWKTKQHLCDLYRSLF